MQSIWMFVDTVFEEECCGQEYLEMFISETDVDAFFAISCCDCVVWYAYGMSFESSYVMETS